jgi:hypothetical protein
VESGRSWATLDWKDKRRYELLFEEAVGRTLRQAGLFPPVSEPVVQFQGAPNPKTPITMKEALDLLWLSSDRFYFIVDVGVFLGGENPPVLFVRPSGHEPRPFADTWDASDIGPFKSLGPIERGRPTQDG